MGNLKGFEKGFTNSKVASHKVINDSHNGGLGIGKFGSNKATMHVGLSSRTKAAVNPTTDADDNPRLVGGSAPQDNGDDSMVPSSKGGASGDGPTPGFNGSGSGSDSLKGAQGRY